jgi:hypothetical protein
MRVIYWRPMMYLKIKFIDDTEEREYVENGESFRVKDGLLIIPKGRYQPSLYINLQMVRSFQEEQ